MRVSELREVLDKLPDDMEVLIAGNGGGLVHVDTVFKARRHRHRNWGLPNWPDEDLVRHDRIDGNDYLAEPALKLEGRRLWFLVEPPWQPQGVWPGGDPLPDPRYDDDRVGGSLLWRSRL